MIGHQIIWEGLRPSGLHKPTADSTEQLKAALALPAGARALGKDSASQKP